MLVDGLTITQSGTIAGSKPAFGAAFPSNPGDGQTFRLTAVVGQNQPGLYWYDGQSAAWAPTGDITAVLAGAGINVTGNRGDITLAVDYTALDSHNDARYLKSAGGTLTGALLLAADPTAALGAATKQYVDAVAQGLDPKGSVRVATTANLAALSGLLTIDGVVLVAGDRVLVKNQTAAKDNGIYVAAAGAWTRAADADASAKVTPGMYAFVEDGTTQAATGWNLITKAVVLGTTALAFTQFGSAVAYTAGTGIDITGNVISLSSAFRSIDIAGSIIGKPAAAALVGQFQPNKPFTIPAGLTGSVGRSTTAATASTVLSLQKNGAAFGTLTWAAGATVATLAAASATTFATTDVLTIVAPGTQDATFANAAFTIAGTLS